MSLCRCVVVLLCRCVVVLLCRCVDWFLCCCVVVLLCCLVFVLLCLVLCGHIVAFLFLVASIAWENNDTNDCNTFTF